MRQYPAPWWYRLAARLAPNRCREIPEATDPDRILLRQVAIVRRTVYLQQLASGENPEYVHRHEGPVLCLGLWGSYTDYQLGCEQTRIKAPYVRYMGRNVWHRVYAPSPGHTSLFAVLRRERERRYAYGGLYQWPWDKHVRERASRL